MEGDYPSEAVSSSVVRGDAIVGANRDTLCSRFPLFLGTNTRVYAHTEAHVYVHVLAHPCREGC